MTNSQWDDGDDVREYSTFFAPDNARCAYSMLSGIIRNQLKGGIRLVSISFDEEHGRLEVVIDHYANASEPLIRVGTRFAVERLLEMSDGDPDAAGLLYLDDLILRPTVDTVASGDSTLWVDRP